ncbi:MAG: VWA domain-containing protein [Gammaproteobacteria bacterium]|nr:VWA domain-containing protein [Gammaproteobacteria bacterium]
MTTPQSKHEQAPVAAELIQARLVQFGQFLRQHHLPSSPDALLDAQKMLALGLGDERKKLRRAFRARFCHTPADWQRFDRVFDLFWQSVIPTEAANTPAETAGAALDTDAGIDSFLGFSGSSSLDDTPQVAGAGDYKALSLADFRFVFNPAEQLAIAAMIDALARKSRRQYRRRTRVRSKGQRIALGASVRNARRTRGQLMSFYYRQRQHRLPRFVLLLDISQSMDVYAKLFLRFTRQLIELFDQSEAYAFNTELIPLGRGQRGLSEQQFERTINAQAKGWLGGTRIADSLARFNAEHLRHTVKHNTTVVIFSDGCDTASSEELIEQLATLQRNARRLIWVNPLLGRFAPGEADRDMDPLQPWIDHYLAAHNIPSLEIVSDTLLR